MSSMAIIGTERVNTIGETFERNFVSSVQAPSSTLIYNHISNRNPFKKEYNKLTSSK